MSPVTEQLIRDYLSRLSIAARGQLGPDDRRALVDKTRDFIEQQTAQAGPPTAFEVARLLFALGDPAELVQQERQRLADLRGEMPAPAASRNPIARALRRDSGKPRGASWHWPAVPGGRTDLQLTLLEGGGSSSTRAEAAGQQSGSQQSGSQQSGSQQSTSSGGASTAANGTNGTAQHDARSGVSAAAEFAPRVAMPRVRPDWFFRKLGREPAPAEVDEPVEGVIVEEPVEGVIVDELVEPLAPLDEGAQAREPAARNGPAWPLTETGAADPGARQLGDTDASAPRAPPASASPAWRLTTPTLPELRRYARRAWAAFADWYSDRPLEASAVILLGLGGVIYPPVWLLGAIVALPSRRWDARDKWLGLLLPILITVIAVALGVTVGGHVSMGQGIHEGWVFGVIGSRISALFSGSYLGWRSLQEPRPPTMPPWNRPHKIS